MHDEVMSQTQRSFTEAYAQSLRVLVCNTESFHKDHLSNHTMLDNVMGWTQTGFTKAFAHSLKADCDLDL